MKERLKFREPTHKDIGKLIQVRDSYDQEWSSISYLEKRCYANFEYFKVFGDDNYYQYGRIIDEEIEYE